MNQKIYKRKEIIAKKKGKRCWRIRMDNRNVLEELWNKYARQTGSVEDRIEAVMSEHVPTLPEEFRGDDREEQYKSFLSEAQTAYGQNAESAGWKGLVASLPAMAAGCAAGAKVGRVAGPWGAIFGSLAGGYLLGRKVEDTVAEYCISKSVERVIDDYVPVLERLD